MPSFAKSGILKAHAQVLPSHYSFLDYMDERRWMSMWHQATAILRLKPATVLEIGPGSGLLKKILSIEGINVETSDVDPALNPDYIASVTELPMSEASYDVVCAFQVLEHLPYAESLIALHELGRVAKGHVLISLPHSGRTCNLQLDLPRIGRKSLLLRLPPKQHVHRFDGQHYWEIGKKGYELRKVRRDFRALSGLSLETDYIVPENPYHRIFKFCR